MNPTPARLPATRQGFTLIELLTVIAIIGILAAIIIPTVGRVRESAKRAKCMSNVRQITMGLVSAANQNRNQAFPSNASGGRWAWDVSITLAKDIANNAGRDVFYCPSSNMLLSNSLDDMYPYQRTNNFAVTGYVLLISGTQQIQDNYLSDRIKSDYPFPKNNPTMQIPASRRALVVDAVISASAAATAASFGNAGGGLPTNVSNHMQNSMPMGGHTGFVDGHVKWRSFVRVTSIDRLLEDFELRSGGDTPKFWF